MIKLVFQKFLKDTFNFFIIMCFSLGIIVWVIQAVYFLDFVSEDGHSLYVYFKYTILNFPKIIHRILPFIFFISLFLQLSKYEYKNQLFIFWSIGVTKIQFINIIILYSIIFSIFQIFLGSYLSPTLQNEARSYIRSSNVDFFPSLIREGKFIDTVSDLTIFIASKNKDDFYQNIFINDSSNKKDKNISQIIYAKKGVLINEDKEKYFKLYNGKIINKEKNKVIDFSFEEIDFSLTKFNSKTTTHPKLQETSSLDLLKCNYYRYMNKISEFKANFFRCDQGKIDEIKQETLKRFYKPIYIPLIGLICCLLLTFSKENKYYNRFKFSLFLFGFFIVVISEISLRFSTYNIFGFLFFTLFPILTFLSIYTFFLFSKYNYRFKS